MFAPIIWDNGKVRGMRRSELLDQFEEVFLRRFRRDHAPISSQPPADSKILTKLKWKFYISSEILILEGTRGGKSNSDCIPLRRDAGIWTFFFKFEKKTKEQNLLPESKVQQLALGTLETKRIERKCFCWCSSCVVLCLFNTLNEKLSLVFDESRTNTHSLSHWPMALLWFWWCHRAEHVSNGHCHLAFDQ